MVTEKEKKEAYGELILSPQITKRILIVLFVSGVVSIVSTLMMVDKFNLPTDKIYYFAIGGVLLLVFLDYAKRLFYSIYVNSEIEAPVNGTNKANLSLIMTLAVVIAILMIDLLGAYSTGIMVETAIKKDSVTNSLDFEILEKNKKAEAITNSLTAYQKALNSFNTRKKDHILACNKSWKTPKYRTKNGECLDKFTEEVPKKKDFTVSAIIKKSDIEKIEKENSNFFVKNVFYFIFGIMGLILGVLNYFALSEMMQIRRNILVLLTPTRISIIRGFLAEIQRLKDEEARQVLEKVQEHTKEVTKQKIEAKELELSLSRNSEEELLNQLKSNVESGNVEPKEYTIYKRKTTDKKPKIKKTNQEKFDAEILKKRLLSEFDEKGKIVSKTTLIDVSNREQDKAYKIAVKELLEQDLIVFKKGYGYYIA